MTKFAATAMLVLLGAVLFAGTPSGWTADFAGAQSRARQENRPMLVLFTGSDWCGWCVKLHRDVLSKPAFRKFAESKNLELVYLDFPRKSAMSAEEKQRNRDLAAKFEVSGFPTTVLLGADGKELGRISGFARDYVGRLSKMLK